MHAMNYDYISAQPEYTIAPQVEPDWYRAWSL